MELLARSGYEPDDLRARRRRARVPRRDRPPAALEPRRLEDELEELRARLEPDRTAPGSRTRRPSVRRRRDLGRRRRVPGEIRDLIGGPRDRRGVRRRELGRALERRDQRLRDDLQRPARRAGDARRRRSNASCSVSPSFAISSPFARSIDFRAASASDSDSASSRSAASSSCRARAALIAGSRSASRNGLTGSRRRPPRPRATTSSSCAVGGEHHDRDRPLVEDPPRRLDPVEPRHLHVEDRQVGLAPSAPARPPRARPSPPRRPRTPRSRAARAGRAG